MTTIARSLLALALLAALAACDPSPYCDPPLGAAVELELARTADPCAAECLEDYLGCLSAEGPGVTEACRQCEFTAATCAASCDGPVIASSTVAPDR